MVVCYLHKSTVIIAQLKFLLITSGVSQLIDNGTLKHTAKTEIKPINAANLRAAHARLESGNSIGKIVLSGW